MVCSVVVELAKEHVMCSWLVQECGLATQQTKSCISSTEYTTFEKFIGICESDKRAIREIKKLRLKIVKFIFITIDKL